MKKLIVALALLIPFAAKAESDINLPFGYGCIVGASMVEEYLSNDLSYRVDLGKLSAFCNAVWNQAKATGDMPDLKNDEERLVFGCAAGVGTMGASILRLNPEGKSEEQMQKEFTDKIPADQVMHACIAAATQIKEQVEEAQKEGKLQ